MTNYSVQIDGKHNDKLGDDLGYYIRIESGPFTGVEFVYQKLDIQENEDRESATAKYDYDILYSPIDEADRQEFEGALGEILEDILTKIMSDGTDSGVELEKTI